MSSRSLYVAAAALIFSSLPAVSTELYRYPVVTPAPRLELRQAASALPACTTLFNALSECGATALDFNTEDAQSLASQVGCLCAPAGTPDAGPFDGLVATCLDESSSADPAGFASDGLADVPTDLCSSIIASASDFDSSTGGTGFGSPSSSDGFDVSATETASSSGAPLITSASASGSGAAACESVRSLATSCISQTSDYLDLPLTDQAQCDCYDAQGRFDSSAYDSVFNACVSSSSSASSDYFQSLTSDSSVVLFDPCSVYASLLDITSGQPRSDVPASATTGGGLGGLGRPTISTSVNAQTPTSSGIAANVGGQGTSVIGAALIGLIAAFV